MPLGESDRVLTILTREYGLIRAVAPGSRKHNSRLGGRSAIFVVNELLIAKGRSLDKITQAETLESYPGLSQNLIKLAASQYLAEIVLCHALSEQPQEELFYLLGSHLKRLEELPKTIADQSFVVLAHLAHAVFHILALAGVAPQVHNCCLSQEVLTPDFTSPEWRVGFSTASGGTVSLPALARWQAEGHFLAPKHQKVSRSLYAGQEALVSSAKENGTNSQDRIAAGTVPISRGVTTSGSAVVHPQAKLLLDNQLTATELALLQQLPKPYLPKMEQSSCHLFFLDHSWLSVERMLRHYTQYHFGRSICSATLIDSYFASLSTSSPSHDALV